MAAPDIVQFSCPIFFTKEGDGHFSVDVMRLGSMAGRVAVRLHTEDGTAKDGTHYFGVDQDVVFEDGEGLVSVDIPINEDDRWAPTVEFKIFLDEPRGCTTGAYLYVSRVKIYTGDTFPSNKYQEQIKLGEEGIDELSGFALFFEFWKYNFETPGMGRTTVLTMVLDQFENAYTYLMLTAKAYLVNYVLDKETDPEDLIIKDKNMCAAAIGMLYVVPLILLQYWKYLKLTIDIEGKTKSELQCSVFTKYLNYNEKSMDKSSPARMQGALISKCGDVAVAYCAVFDILKNLCGLGVLAFFTLVNDPSSWWVLIVMPTLMLIFGYCRSDELSKADAVTSPLNRKLLQLINEACNKYNLIAEYTQRPRMNEIFAQRSEQVRKAVIPQTQVETNNKFFPNLLGPFFAGMFILLYAPRVIQGTMKLGSFLAMITVFERVASGFSGIYESLMDINTRLDSMIDVTKLLNNPTDVPDWRALNRKRREKTVEYRAQVLRQPPPDPKKGILRTDMIPIELSGVSVRYEGSPILLSDISVSVPQGKIVAVVGPHGQGATVFMKLLGQRVFPSDGFFFIPSHLRVLFVQQNSTIMDMSLWENLTFGNPRLSADSAEDRAVVTRILESVDLSRFAREFDFARDAFVSDSLESEPTIATSRQSAQKSPRAWPHRSGYVKFKEVPCELESLEIMTSSSPRRQFSQSDSDDSEDADMVTSDDDASEAQIIQYAGCCNVLPDGQGEKALKEPESIWRKTITDSDRAKICLARAFIMNPEVLVLHRPLIHYVAKVSTKILEALTEHHNNRGLALPSETKNMRRPRSTFFTPQKREDCQIANFIWHHGNGKVTVIPPDATGIADIKGIDEHFELAMAHQAKQPTRLFS